MLPSSSITRSLDGVSTDVLIQVFADQILILITQLGKVGSLIQATIPSTTPLALTAPLDPSNPNVTPLPQPPPSIELTSLLGSAPNEHLRTLHSLFASQAATLVWVAQGDSLDVERQGVVVGIALRQAAEPGRDGHLSPHEKAVFHGVMDMVKELLGRE